MNDHTSTLWEQDTLYWEKILSFPKISPPSLPLYEEATLPQQDTLGKMALLVGEEDPTLIFFNGKAWQQLMKGKSL